MPPVLGEDKAGGGHQANKGKQQGQEVLMHQLRYTKIVLCNLIFLIPPEVPKPASCLFLPSSKQWKQSRLLLAYRIGPVHRRMRESVLHHVRYTPLLQILLISEESQKTGELYFVT